MKNEQISEDKPKDKPTDDDPVSQPTTPETDAVVADIVKHDDDELLKKQDAPSTATASNLPWYKKLLHKKKVVIPAAIVLMLAILCLVPQTRYPIFGLFWKQNYKLTLLDSQTNQPVSSATVSLAGQTATTDNHGNASLKVKVGHHVLTVTKKYYTDLNSNVLVPLRVRNSPTVTLRATGRQVPITITNKITGKPIENAVVKAVSTEAHTDKTGQVVIVLPADKSRLTATISASGYNTTPATITVTTQTVKANDFQLTPSGKVYFLSKLSGKIDVVKTNLDGTERQTVLAGTGNENDATTVLLASRDWHFLALLAKRDTDQSNNSVYLIDTTTDKLTTMDVGQAQFTAIGWEGHYFVYDVIRNNIATNVNNHEALKSYNADNSQLATLDQSKTDTTNNIVFYSGFSDYYLQAGELIYFVRWTQFSQINYVANATTSQSDSIRMAALSSQSTKDLKTFDANQFSYNRVALYEPASIYYGIYAKDGTSSFYKLENNTITTATNVDSSTFDKNYSTFLLSPSGNQTFWSEARDGKNSLFIGDANAQSPKTIATLSDYDTFGWYSDNYVLVSKNSSELYILAASGGTAFKISDYHKPAQVFSGYGGGYGGR